MEAMRRASTAAAPAPDSGAPRAETLGRRSTAADVTAGMDLRGRTIAITGASGGIGRELATVLTSRGARVLALCRSLPQAQEVASAVPRATPLACDLEDPASVQAAVDAIARLGEPLHAIVANAGVMAPPTLETARGIERQFLTNHVGHHLLVTRLAGSLAVDARVVVVASSLHKAAPPAGIDFDNLDGSKGYSPWAAYGRSKLANVLFARSLARRLSPKQTANAVHPGVAQTGLQRRLRPATRLLFAIGAHASKSVPQAAATPAFAAVHPAAARYRGAYLADCAPVRLAGSAVDDALAERLWARTEEILRDLGAPAA